MLTFETAFAELMRLEGGYVNDYADRGGRTNYGVTEALARRYGYQGDMRNLSTETAKYIAKCEFWDRLRLSTIATLDEKIAFELFDTSYNQGWKPAAKSLQRALNVLNRMENDFNDLVVDGHIGSITLATLEDFLRIRNKDGAIVLLRILNCLQGARYVEIAEGRELNEKFVFGWFLNRVRID